MLVVRNFTNKVAVRMMKSSPVKNSKSPTTKLSPTSHLEVLLNSARIGNTESILQLYNKRLDLTLQDKNGNTALHLAAKAGHQELCRMLVVLTFPTEIEQIRNQSGETALNLAEDVHVIEDLKLLENGVGQRKEDLNTFINDKLVDEIAPEWPKNTKLALSLDGGGVKLLILAQTLLHLNKLVGGDLMDKIDWVAGTSAGGVLAVTMGVGHSLEYGRHFFLSSGCKEVFCGNNVTLPKHNISGFEKAAKRLYETKRMDSIKQKLFVTVSDTRKSPSELVLFRSYLPNISKEACEEYGYFDPSKILVWKAARCTSAAPYFFESFNGLSDGGIIANNPTQCLIAEFLQFNALEMEEAMKQNKPYVESHLGCVLSLGTGVSPQETVDGIDVNFQFIYEKNPFSMARGFWAALNTAATAFGILLKEITASNGQPVVHSRAWAHSLGVPFFRFSPHLKKDYPIDETNTHKLIEILWETEMYLRGEARKDLEQFARLISTKPANNYQKAGSPTSVTGSQSDERE